MSKELENLEKLISFASVMSANMIGLSKGNYDSDTFIKKTYDYLHKYYVDATSELELERALQRLETIDNTNPSEALECLEILEDHCKSDYTYYNYLYDFDKELSTIKNYILKTQELEDELAYEIKMRKEGA